MVGCRRIVEEIKGAMAFLLTMHGVPFVYYGDEKVIVTKWLEFKRNKLLPIFPHLLAVIYFLK